MAAPGRSLRGGLVLLVGLLATLCISVSGALAQDRTAIEPEPGDRLGQRAVGRTAYDFQVTTTSGDPVTANDVRNTPYALLLVAGDCSASGRVARRVLEAMRKIEGMRLIVVVAQPQRTHSQAPNDRMAARRFEQRLVAGHAVRGRVSVGTTEARLRTDLGSLVYGGTDRPLLDVPALFTMDARGVIRGARIGDAPSDVIEATLRAAATPVE